MKMIAANGLLLRQWLQEDRSNGFADLKEEIHHADL
jgi:hypothetical protein